MVNESTKWLYERLKSRGYNVGKDQAEFDSLMENNEESRAWAYETATSLGLNVGKDIDEFTALVAPEYTARQTGGVQPQRMTTVVRPVANNTAWDAAQEAAWQQTASQGVPVSGSDAAGGSELRRGGEDFSVPTDEAEAAGDSAGRVEEEPQQVWKPTPMQRLSMSHEMDQILKQKDAMLAQSEELTQNLSEYYDRGKGLGFQTVKGQPVFNPETGQLEQSYLTPMGNRYKDKALADVESFRYREAADMSVGAQLRRAEAELAALNKQLDESASRVHKEWADDYEKNDAPLAAVLAANTYVPRQHGDNENSALRVAIRQKEEQIQKLRNERDRQTGKDVGFWRGFGQTMGDVRTWDFGLGDLSDAITMMNADRYSSPEATEGERRAGQAMMKAIYDNEETGRMYEDSNWYKWGVMTGYMPSFMLDFALTGGGFKAINVAGKAAAKGASKWLGKEVLKEMSKLGVKQYAKKYGAKGVGRMAGNWTIKALGTTADELLLRAPLMTNTIQAGKTAADIIDRKLGDVVVDENGNYDFSNDRTWGIAVWQGEANAIIENYSEMFGKHLDGIMPMLAKIFGGKRISGMLARANASSYGQIVNTTRKQFERLGVSDYIGEVGEEYYGQLWRSMLNLDDAYKQNPDGTRTNLFLDGQFHGDIWCGMALSMGLMGAGKYTISGAAYGHMKHQVNVADRRASQIFTPDRWEPIREVVDNTTNEDMGELADKMVNDPSLSNEERGAVMDYMERSMNLRGHNLGSIAKSRGAESDPMEQVLNESYIDGYEAATPREMTDAQNMYDLQRQRVEGMFNAKDIAELEANPVSALREMSNNERYSQEEIDAACDYINAKTVRDGIMQRVNDNIDEQIAQSDAMIEGRVNRITGMIQPAIMAGVVDRQVFVVDGYVAVNDDGTVDRQASDKTIIVRDAQTGKVEFADPKSILSVGAALDPEMERAAAVDAIRQQGEQAAAEAMSGTLAFKPGEMIEIGGGRTATVVGPAVDKEGHVVEGQVSVTLNDGSQAVMSKEQLQQESDAFNRARLQGFEEQRAVANRARKEEAGRPRFALYDEFTILGDKGNPIRGSIESVADEDGYVLIKTEEPIGGMTVSRVRVSDLEDMIVAAEGHPKYTSGRIKIRNSDGTETRGFLTSYVDDEGKYEYYLESDLKRLYYASESELDNMLSEYEPDEAQEAETPENVGAKDLQSSGNDVTLPSELIIDGYGTETFERDNDERRQADGGRMADDAAGVVEATGDRGDIRVFEEGLATSYNEHSEYSERNRRDAESERLVGIAKANGLYVPAKEIAVFGDKHPKHSGESDVYVNREDGRVYKVKDPYAKSPMKSGVEPEDVIYEHLVHNALFPEAPYRFEGISEDLGDVRIVLSQPYIQSIGQPTQQQIEAALAERGLRPEGNYRYGNEYVSVTDVTGDNALLGEDGRVYFIDPIIGFKKPVSEILDSYGKGVQGERAEQTAVPKNGESVPNSAEIAENSPISIAESAESVPREGNNVVENIFSAAQPVHPQPIQAPAEAAAQPTLLQRIPRDEKGEPMFERADSPEMAWDALVEFSDGDVATAKEIADAMAEEKRKALEKAQELKPKGKTPTEILASKRANAAELARAEEEYSRWQQMAQVQPGRENAMRLQQEEEARRVLAEREEAEKAGRAEHVTGALDVSRRRTELPVDGVERVPQAVSVGIEPIEVNEGDSDLIIKEMEENAADIPNLELNPDNWLAEFGEAGIVATPIGDVKMGENQIAKLFEKGRKEQFGMIKPTLSTPHIIIEVPSSSIDGNEERGTSLLFVKTFRGKNGDKIYFFKSVTVRKDGLEVSVSSHYDRAKRIKDAIEKGKLLYRFDGGAQTEHRPADVSVTASRENSQGESSSWEGGDSSISHADDTAPAISLESRHDVNVSDGKGNTLSTEEQVDGEKSSLQGQSDQGSITLGQRIAAASEAVNTHPTEAQKEAGNYKKGHVQVGSFDVTIEQPVGSVRRGTDANGKQWESTMHHTYGYIRGTEGVDGDHIDVFISADVDGWNGRKAFVVDQYNPDGTFDEHKVMLGFNDRDEAFAAYLSNYEQGWEKGRRLDCTEVNMEDFEKWIESSHRKTKAFSEYKGVKSAEPTTISKMETSTPTNGYTVEPAQYTTKRGKVLDMQLVKFDRELTKDEQQGAKALAKSLKGWWDSKQGGFMMRSAEDARSLGEVVIPKSAAVSSATQLEETESEVGKSLRAGEDILQMAERIVREEEEKRQAQEKSVGKSDDSGKEPVSLEQWRQMNGDERMAEAGKRSLTREEIESASTDEALKANALDYLKGNQGMIQSISYLKVYEDVRYSNGNSAADSGISDSAQLDAADTGIQQELDVRDGGQSGDSNARMDRKTGEEGVSAAEGPLHADPSDARGVTTGNGNGSSEPLPVREPVLQPGDSRGDVHSGSRVRSGEGRDVGGRTGRKGSTTSRKNSKRGVQADTTGNAKNDGGLDLNDPLDKEIADAMKEFDSVLDEFKRAGKEELSMSLVGMNGRQLEVLPRLISAGAKVGYAYVKKGVHGFAEWAKRMRAVFGEKLADAGLGKNEIEAFISEMWKSQLPMDGEVHTLEEWASIFGNAELRKKIGGIIEEKRKAQQAAESIPVKTCDRENIEETLPFLLPQQQDDVLKAETQFFDESHNDQDHAFGKGYMFTNGTGTGKTYTGLGIVKRFIKQGKGRILILTPSQTKVKDWVKDASNLGIELNDLDVLAKAKKDGTTATAEKGEGAVITTYANFRQNKALLEDLFDLIVYDESHRLLENKGGVGTTGAMQHYKLSNRNEQYAFLRLQEIDPTWKAYNAKIEAFNAQRDAIIERLKKENGTDRELTFEQRGELPPVFNGRWDEGMERKFPELAHLRQEIIALDGEFRDEITPKLEQQAKEHVKHTKVVFLSATPFNTRENLDYAEGYIFSYPEREVQDGYSVQSPRSQFYLEHFGAGYKWRYHRLESNGSNPEAVSKQEVEFSDYLQHTLQTMSGRIIDSPYDYSRDFPTVTLDKAEEFNSAMEELAHGDSTGHAYCAVMRDYNYTSALFESMKVGQIIPRLKEHLARGRKAVIFHRRVESRHPIVPPFRAIFAQAVKDLEGVHDASEKERKSREISALRRKYSNLLEWERGLDLRMPREQLSDAFGKDEVLFFSGKESDKAKNKSVGDFNNDDSGKNIIVIQEASGKEGISLHDTTGKHQRVLVTLALPQSPITALQTEGRIYRIGNKSNAIFEYPLLGLNTELMLFGQKFNQQVSTTENLALGSQARNLRESFARGVEEHSGDVDIDRQGVGGKESDAPYQIESDAFDRAVLDYYTNQRLTGKRDNRDGKDYYPTPEPLGFMMNRWGRIGEGESVLEPSAGHGAIARYVSRENALTAIEPSQRLFGKLQIKAGGNGRKFENTVFENYHVVNKHDVVLMNPPFGSGGRLAVDHVAKAFQHLEEGGRIVAIIPRGSADQKFDKWYDEQQNAALTAEIGLPDITFERAGTSVNCRVVIIDKITNETLRQTALSRSQYIDLSGGHYEKIEDFFDEIRGIEVPDRTIDRQARMKKKAVPSARELRTVKGIRVVYLGEDKISVSGSGVWAEIAWGDKQGDALTAYLSDRYARFKSNYDYAVREGRSTQEAAYGEMKDLACKLAGMTEDEMCRYIGKKSGDDVLYRLGDGAQTELLDTEASSSSKGLAYLEIEPGSEYGASPEGDLRFREMGIPATFEARRDKSIRDNGIVADGLNEAEVRVVEVAHHDFAGEQPIAQAKAWAKDHIVGEHELASGTRYVISKSAVDKYLSQSATGKSENLSVHLSVLKHLPEVIGASIDAEVHPDYKKGEDGVRRAENGVATNNMLVHRMYGAVNIDGTTYRVKTTLHEFAPNVKETTAPHSFEVTKIEVLDESNTSDGAQDAAPENRVGPLGTAKLLQGVEKSYEKGKKLLDESRKLDVVDRQGDGYGRYSDSEISYVNDPVSQLLGKNRFSKKRQGEFAARERQRMVTRVEDLAERLHLDNVEIITDASQLDGYRSTSKGFFNKKTGKITIVVPNHVSIFDVEQTLLHEAVAHYGLRQLFGEHFDTFLDNVYEAADDSIRRQIYSLATRNGFDIRRSTEEYLASLAERMDFEASINSGLWPKVKELFLRMLKKIGFKDFQLFGITLGDNELRYILWRSYENLAEPGRYRSLLGEAVDVAKQLELKVGNYAPTAQDVAMAIEAARTDAIGETFDEQLEQFKNGKLKQGHRFELGMPSQYLRSAGFPNLPISMRASLLEKKASMNRHPFSADDLKGLVQAMQKPIAIFSYTKENMRNLIVDIKRGDKHFLVGVTLNYKAGDIEINSVSGLFPKDSQEWLKWIQDGKAIRIDQKEKVQAIIDSQRTTNTVESDRIGLNLEEVANVIEKFENPTIEEEYLLFRGGGTAREEYDRRVRVKVVDKRNATSKTVNRAGQLHEAYFDSMRSLNILQEAVSHETGKPIEDYEDAYTLENQMTSRCSAAEEEYKRDFFAPLCRAIADICKGMESSYRELLDYVIAKHGLERNEYMRKKAEESGEQGDRDFSGLTALTGEKDVTEAERKSAAMVAAYESAHDTSDLWRRIHAATSATLRTRYEEGLLSRDVYERIQSQYKYYIPLKGWDENTALDVYEYAAGAYGLSSALMTAYGRSSLSDDPFATIMVDAQRTIMEANRNRMKLAFLHLALNHETSLLTVGKQWYVEGDDGTWRPDYPIIPADADADTVDAIVKEHEAEMIARGSKARTVRSGLRLGVVTKNADISQHIVQVKRNGERFCIYVNGDPRAARAINGLLNPDSGEKTKLEKIAHEVKSFMAKSVTSWNPEFTLGNLSRDVMFAGVSVAVKEDEEYVTQYTRNIKHILSKAALPRLQYRWEHGTLDVSTETGRYFAEFLRNGGQTGFIQLHSVDKAKRDMQRFLREAQGDGVSISRKAWRGFWDGVEFMNRSTENTVRFAVYLTSRQQGRSVIRSISDAKEITVNYNRKGSGALLARHLDFLYLFFKASMQALANAARLAYRNPGKASVAAGSFMSAGFLLPLLACISQSMSGSGDGDDDNSYWDLSEWVRRNNLVFHIPFTNKFITLPISHELRPFYGIGEIAFSVMCGKETVEDGLWKGVEGFTGLFPIDLTGNGGDLWVNLTPSIAQPLSQVARNVNYFGNPIYKNTPWNGDEPAWTKSYKGTNRFFVDLSKMLSESMSTRDEYDVVSYPKHWWSEDINPAVVEHLLESYTGGLGKTINRTGKTISMLWNEDARELRNVPVLRKFVSSIDESSKDRRFSNDYFKIRDEYEESKEYLRKLVKLDDDGFLGVSDRIVRWLDSDAGKRYDLQDDYFKEIRFYEQELREEESDSIRALLIHDIDSLKRELVSEVDSLNMRAKR